MNTEELRGVIEDSSDKLKIFDSREILSQCDITYSELIGLINEFLTEKKIICFGDGLGIQGKMSY